jgi:hypothetical protein
LRVAVPPALSPSTILETPGGGVVELANSTKGGLTRIPGAMVDKRVTLIEDVARLRRERVEVVDEP